MRKRLVAVDLFCGGGGTSMGMMLAAAALGIDRGAIDLTAVNHWPVALETHAANHPAARHLCARIEQIQPERIVPGGRADLLWASPECTHHSVARGGRPCNDQSRSQAFTVLDWAERLKPRAVLIENVPEFSGWGPLYADGPKAGQPIRARSGETFRAWLAALQSLGYRAEWRTLVCADYGDATTRERFFLVARRGNHRPAWPEPTHAREPGLFGAKPWVPARDIIDWSIPGHSIFLTREDVRAAGLKIQRPLADNTLRRIEAWIRKYWGAWAEPFLALLRGTGDWQISQSCLRLDRPLPSQTTSGHFGIISPFFVRFNGERAGQGARTHGVGSPVPVIDTSGRYGICAPFVLGQHSGGAPRGVDAPMVTVCTESRGIALLQPFMMATGQTGGNGQRIRLADMPLSSLVTKAEQCLISPFLVKYYRTGTATPIDEPIDAVTANGRFGLVRPILVEAGGELYLLDILLRMLTPAELAAAHSFPADYQWRGTKTQIIKQIGNSVPVRTAQALCTAQLAG